MRDFSMTFPWLFHDFAGFSMTFAVFHDYPGLEYGLPKSHDFPGPVVTLSLREDWKIAAFRMSVSLPMYQLAVNIADQNRRSTAGISMSCNEYLITSARV